MSEQLYNLLEQLIVKNNIRINQEELKIQLFSHPSYPSVHALTGILHHFKIPNLALRLPTNIEILAELPQVFIANILENQEEKLVLVERKKEKLLLTFDRREKKEINAEYFLRIWTGVIIAIEKDEEIKEANRNTWIPLINRTAFFFSILLIGYFSISNANLFAGSHFLLSIVGLAISFLIVQQELGLQSSLTNNFCNLSEGTSCDAVLNSKGATLFGTFKLSDLSIVAFATYNLNWFLLFINETSNFTAVAIVTLLAVPFTIYSLYYQYRVIKKWCPLCLGIVAILILQTGTLFLIPFSFSTLTFEYPTFLLFLLSGLITSLAWIEIRSLIQKKVHLKTLQLKHYSFKRNFALFSTFYRKSAPLKTTLSIPGEIILGNPNASFEIIIVSTPLCFFCKEAHDILNQIINRLPSKVKIIFRFNIKNRQPQNTNYQLAAQLLHHYHNQGKEQFQQTLNKVYHPDINLTKWLEKQDLQFSAAHDTLLEQQYDWCTANAINFTPALYLNKFPFPEEYDRSDLLFFIDNLIDEQQRVLPAINKASIAS